MMAPCTEKKLLWSSHASTSLKLFPSSRSSNIGTNILLRRAWPQHRIYLQQRLWLQLQLCLQCSLWPARQRQQKRGRCFEEALLVFCFCGFKPTGDPSLCSSFLCLSVSTSPFS